MQLEDYFDFSDPDYIGIKGHRLGIHNVLNYFLSGSSPEEIAAEYPGLSDAPQRSPPTTATRNSSNPPPDKHQ